MEMGSIKFTKIALLLVAATAIASCAKEIAPESANGNEPAVKTKTITITAGIDTKLTLTPGDSVLRWKQGDSIDVFNDYNDTKIQLKAPKDLDEVMQIEVPESATKVYAVYRSNPANKKNSADITISASQSLSSAGNLNGTYCPMTSAGDIVGDHANISFKPVGGILALNLYNTNTESTAKNVTKVVVKPLTSGGSLDTKFCGTATTDLTGTIAYDPTSGWENGVSVSLKKSCEVGSTKPTTEKEIKSHKEQVYVNLARKSYDHLRIEVYTEDGAITVLTTTTGKVYDFTANDIIYQNVNIGNASAIKADENDYYSQYLAGMTINVAGKSVSKSEFPNVTLITPKTLSHKNFSDTSTTVLFIDNETESENTFSYTSILTVKAGKIVIGRYRNKKQAVISLAETKMLRLIGDVWIRNIRIETNSSTYGILEGKQVTGEDGKYTWNLEDCSLINSSAGIYRYNHASYAVPKSITLNNCIIRCAGPLFGVGKNSNAKDLPNISYLRTISMDNCVVAPYSATNTVNRLEADGIIVNLGSGSDNTYATDELAVSITDCSFYDMGTVKQTRGMIDVITIGSMYVYHTAFHHNATITPPNKFYTVYAYNACTGPGSIYLGATYTDHDLHANGNKSNLGNNGERPCTLSLTQATSTFDIDNIQPANDYFPAKIISSGATKVGGASYDTKYWIKLN